MADKLTVAELENRWDYALRMTRLAVSRQPAVYGELKSLAAGIAAHSLDIREYLPTVNQLISLLQKLDPGDHGSIFSFFNDRIHPSSVWSTCWLRMECKDLLAHLDAFKKWRLSTHRLKVLK